MIPSDSVYLVPSAWKQGGVAATGTAATSCLTTLVGDPPYRKCIKITQRRRNLQIAGYTNQYKITRSAQSARDFHGSILFATVVQLAQLRTTTSHSYPTSTNDIHLLHQHLAHVANTCRWLWL